MAQNQIATVRWQHDAIIDAMLADPTLTRADLARSFKYSETWISIILNSDSFKERFAERKGQITDPILQATINERLDGIAMRSLDKIIERLDGPGAGGIKLADLVSVAKLGVGDKNTRPSGPVQQNNLYVVNLPPPARNSSAWLDNTQGNKPPGVLPIVEELDRG
jgi:hypothetical protein